VANCILTQNIVLGFIFYDLLVLLKHQMKQIKYHNFFEVELCSIFMIIHNHSIFYIF